MGFLKEPKKKGDLLLGFILEMGLVLHPVVWNNIFPSCALGQHLSLFWGFISFINECDTKK